MSQHTPGPWTYTFEENGGYDGLEAAFHIVAGAQRLAEIGVDNYVPVDASDDRELQYKLRHARNPEAESDARLMAAAPDLLAALRDVVGQGPRYAPGDVRNAVYDRARALLARVDGAA